MKTTRQGRLTCTSPVSELRERRERLRFAGIRRRPRERKTANDPIGQLLCERLPGGALHDLSQRTEGIAVVPTQRFF
jgi:hypothetical protein